MENLATKTIRDIALEYPATVRVFEEFEIDYCCGGRRTIGDACTAAGIDASTLADRIETTIEMHGENPTLIEPEHKKPSELIEYIIAKHHIFTVSELERLTLLMAKVVSRHGANHPNLFELQSIFTALAESLVPHMRKEEGVLFPYIQMLEASADGNISAPIPHFGTVQNPIRMMMSDHDTDGARLKKMRGITSEYTLPEGACPTFTALYAGLQDLERDLHRHIHLENNVLFPQAVRLEEQVAGVVQA